MAGLVCIKKLTIARFRGVKTCEWRPSPGMNLILGGGDIGKTTILEAIGLLFSPTNSSAVSENDYWERSHRDGFEIEAVIDLSGAADFSQQKSFAWPWHWDGKEAVLPEDPGENDKAEPTTGKPVYRVRVRGTDEFEFAWEIVQPGGDVDHFSVAARRRIGLIKMSAEDRNDRDLRLIHGSALDRLFADSALRARIGKKIADIDLTDPLGGANSKKLSDLDASFQKESLPHGLGLGLTSSHGLSIGALIGLHADRGGIDLPLSTWGAGTRRMSALEIASAIEREASLTTVDEIERGLEPYRLRKLIRQLLAQPGQRFVTTHSPVVIAASGKASLWYMAADAVIGGLPHDAIRQQQVRDPETFLSKYPLIAEGPTEVGFLRYLLKKAFEGDPLDHGVRVCDGQGNQSSLNLLEAINKAGLRFATLVDDESDFGGRWKAMKSSLGNLMHQWVGGCTEQRVIAAIPDIELDKMLTDEEGKPHYSRLGTLAERLGIGDSPLAAIKQAASAQGLQLRALLIAAASGSKEGAPAGREKQWAGHGKRWFKTLEGGHELAQKMVSLGAWPTIQKELMPLINAVLTLAGLPERADLPL